MPVVVLFHTSFNPRLGWLNVGVGSRNRDGSHSNRFRVCDIEPGVSMIADSTGPLRKVCDGLPVASHR